MTSRRQPLSTGNSRSPRKSAIRSRRVASTSGCSFSSSAIACSRFCRTLSIRNCSGAARWPSSASGSAGTSEAAARSLENLARGAVRGRARDARKPRQFLARARPRLRDLVERSIGQDPAARQVACHRAFLAPAGKRRECGLRRGLHSLEALQAPPGVGGFDAVERDISQRTRIPLPSRRGGRTREALVEQRGQFRQVAHVIGGVGELLGRQRAPRPVRARVALARVPRPAAGGPGPHSRPATQSRAARPRSGCRRPARAACRSAAAGPRCPGEPHAAASAAADRRAPRPAYAHPRSRAGRSARGCHRRPPAPGTISGNKSARARTPYRARSRHPSARNRPAARAPRRRRPAHQSLMPAACLDTIVIFLIMRNPLPRPKAE